MTVEDLHEHIVPGPDGKFLGHLVIILTRNRSDLDIMLFQLVRQITEYLLKWI